MIEISNKIPPMLTGEALDNMMRIMPSYNQEIKDADMSERLIELQNIYSVFVPNAMSREVYSKLYMGLLRSLNKKSSSNAIRQISQNHNRVINKGYDSILGGADSFTIIGPSGIGKSSCVSRAVNIISGNIVIEQNETIIIPCLTVQSPADSSVKGLLLEILRRIDEVLDTQYYIDAIKSRSTVDMLIGSVSQVCLMHVGLLIVDEIQNVVNNKNGRIIIGTLTQLINNSGISIAMIGAPEATIFFSKALMLARRSLGLTYDAMKFDEEFKNFCRSILRYCYVK